MFFNIKACISLIKADQALWYRACKTCNKKVTEAIGSGYWCEGCQKNEAECNLRLELMIVSFTMNICFVFQFICVYFLTREIF